MSRISPSWSTARQKYPLGGDPHHHLVEMPTFAWPRETLAQPSCDRGIGF
jgi:hypothetical protein